MRRHRQGHPLFPQLRQLGRHLRPRRPARGWIRGLSAKPLGWGLLYVLVLIPLFAVLYGLNASGFYQSTSTREPAFIFERSQLQEQLGYAVANEAQRTADQKFPSAHMSGSAFVTDLQMDPQGLTLYVNAQSERGFQNVALRLGVPENPDEKAMFDKDYYRYTISDVALGSDSQFPSAEVTGPTNAYALLHIDSEGTNSLVLVIPQQSVRRQLYQVWRSSQGYADSLHGLPLRMLYLSAVRATTLGYGDIVPVTTTTRGLITAEAVSGAVLVGLFLNALARSRSVGRREDTS